MEIKLEFINVLLLVLAKQKREIRKERPREKESWVYFSINSFLYSVELL